MTAARVPDPFPHEDDFLEPALRSIWAGDEPPEQVDIDAMRAYRQTVECPICGRYDHQLNACLVTEMKVEWPSHPRRRAVIAWVGLAIGLASVAAICISIGLLIESHL